MCSGYDGHNIVIDVIVSFTLPVNDFDVNQLTYDGTFKSYGNKSTEHLIELINNKTLNALPEFNYYNMTQKRRFQQTNRMQKLINTGWTVNMSSKNKFNLY